MSERSTTALFWMVAVCVIAAGLVAYAPILDHFPWKTDAVTWTVNTSVDTPGHWNWALFEAHFIGYRPVAALTYMANSAMTGFEPGPYRLTDLTLHGLVVLATGVLARAVIPDLSRPAQALAMLVVLLHPAAAEVAPHLARRSYSLATLTSTLGLAAFAIASHRPRAIGWVTAGTLAVWTSLFSHELAYAALPPALWMLRGQGRHAWVRRSLPLMSGSVFALAARWSVLGNGGGYEMHWFAHAPRGSKILTEVEGFEAHRIVGAALEYTWLPISMAGRPHPLRARWIWQDIDVTIAPKCLLGLVAAYVLWNLVIEPIRRRESPGPLAATGAWMLVLAGLSAATETWFWRQGYPMVVPLGVLVASLAHRTRHPIGFVPQAILWGGLAFHSSSFWGLDDRLLRKRSHASTLIHASVDLFDQKAPDRVFLAANLPGPDLQMAIGWMRRVRPASKSVWTVLAQTKRRANLIETRGPGWIGLHPAARIPRNYLTRTSFQGRRLRMSDLASDAQRPWLIYPTDAGSWNQLDLKTP